MIHPPDFLADVKHYTSHLNK